jgi:hypothetical protein
MKLQKLLVGAVALLAPMVAASDAGAETAETFRYEVSIDRPTDVPAFYRRSSAAPIVCGR